MSTDNKLSNQDFDEISYGSSEGNEKQVQMNRLVLNVDKKAYSYKGIHEKLAVCAEQCVKDFSQYCDTMVTDSASIYSHAIPRYYEEVEKLLRETILILDSYNLTMDFDALAKNSDIIEAADIPSNYYKKLLQEAFSKIEKIQTKQLKREMNHSYWVGGGFGLVGALKGAAMASVMNGVSSAIKSVSDSALNARDKSEIKTIISDIYNKSSPKGIFTQGIYGMKSVCFLIALNLLIEYEKLDACSFSDNSERIKSCIAQKTFANGYIKGEPLKSYLREAISGFPYNYNYYVWLFLYTRTPYECISSAADEFSMKEEVRFFTSLLIGEKFGRIGTMPDSTVKEAKEKYDEYLSISNWKRYLPDNYDKRLRDAKSKYEYLDQKEREEQERKKKIENIRSLSEKVQKQVQEVIQPIYESIDKNDIDQTWKYINENNAYAQVYFRNKIVALTSTAKSKKSVDEILEKNKISQKAEEKNLYADFLREYVYHAGKVLTSENKIQNYMSDYAQYGVIDAIGCLAEYHLRCAAKGEASALDPIMANKYVRIAVEAYHPDAIARYAYLSIFEKSQLIDKNHERGYKYWLISTAIHHQEIDIDVPICRELMKRNNSEFFAADLANVTFSNTPQIKMEEDKTVSADSTEKNSIKIGGVISCIVACMFVLHYITGNIILIPVIVMIALSDWMSNKALISLIRKWGSALYIILLGNVLYSNADMILSLRIPIVKIFIAFVIIGIFAEISGSVKIFGKGVSLIWGILAAHMCSIMILVGCNSLLMATGEGYNLTAPISFIASIIVYGIVSVVFWYINNFVTTAEKYEDREKVI